MASIIGHPHYKNGEKWLLRCVFSVPFRANCRETQCEVSASPRRNSEATCLFKLVIPQKRRTGRVEDGPCRRLQSAVRPHENTGLQERNRHACPSHLPVGGSWEKTFPSYISIKNHRTLMEIRSIARTVYHR